MSARERLAAMIRTDAGSLTVWSTAEVQAALDLHAAEVLAKHGRTGEKCIPTGEQLAEDGATHRHPHPRPCEFPEVLPCLCVRPGRLPDWAFEVARSRARIAAYFRCAAYGRAAAAEQRGAAA
ncbi:hypothetical protein AB0420_02165 [Streptomyces caelestis]|uniref:hypothetical protein n=1 Tax=Streptomyces caelestis TaxID=36816 RepID=UPI0034505C63